MKISEKVFTNEKRKGIIGVDYNPLKVNFNKIYEKREELHMKKEELNLKEFINIRIKQNSNLFSKEEILLIEDNINFTLKMYLLGMLDNI